jgi:hypothetical protein
VTCYVVNENSATDISFDFQVSLVANNQVVWNGALVISGDLAAANNGVPNGLAAFNYPANRLFSQSGTDTTLGNDRQQWADIVDAATTLSYSLTVTAYGAR